MQSVDSWAILRTFRNPSKKHCAAALRAAGLMIRHFRFALGFVYIEELHEAVQTKMLPSFPPSLLYAPSFSLSCLLIQTGTIGYGGPLPDRPALGFLLPRFHDTLELILWFILTLSFKDFVCSLGNFHSLCSKPLHLPERRHKMCKENTTYLMTCWMFCGSHMHCFS